jgi:7-carboxy-7-deazaguanine synthase
MTYAVKEIFYSLQGEGINAGRPAVFCRFAGCNLWSGRERDRAKAVCNFCDTDFVGGRKFTTAQLGNEIEKAWGECPQNRLVILTGGEPLLQVDDSLLAELKVRGFWVAVETNGTLPVPPGIDWITVSPKAKTLVQSTGNELKLVYPTYDPAAFEELDFDHFLLQPMDGSNREENTASAVAYCLKYPLWRLSLQTHKLLGLR